MSTPLQRANDRIAEIADIPDDDLFEEERHMLALHDERNRLTADLAALRARLAESEKESAKWEKLAKERGEGEVAARVSKEQAERERDEQASRVTGATRAIEVLKETLAKVERERDEARATARQEKEHHDFYQGKVLAYMGAEQEWIKATAQLRADLAAAREDTARLITAAENYYQRLDGLVFPINDNAWHLKKALRAAIDSARATKGTT